MLNGSVNGHKLETMNSIFNTVTKAGWRLLPGNQSDTYKNYSKGDFLLQVHTRGKFYFETSKTSDISISVSSTPEDYTKWLKLFDEVINLY